MLVIYNTPRMINSTPTNSEQPACVILNLESKQFACTINNIGIIKTTSNLKFI